MTVNLSERSVPSHLAIYESLDVGLKKKQENRFTKVEIFADINNPLEKDLLSLAEKTKKKCLIHPRNSTLVVVSFKSSNRIECDNLTLTIIETYNAYVNGLPILNFEYSSIDRVTIACKFCEPIESLVFQLGDDCSNIVLGYLFKKIETITEKIFTNKF